MRRRSRAGGEPIKTRRRKAAPLKRGNAPKSAHRRSSSAANLHKQARAADARARRGAGAADGDGRSSGSSKRSRAGHAGRRASVHRRGESCELSIRETALATLINQM